MSTKSAKVYREDARHLRALAAQAAGKDKRHLLGMAGLFEYFANRPNISRGEHRVALEGQAPSASQFGNEKANPSPGDKAYCEHQQQSREPRDLGGLGDGENAVVRQ